MGRIPNRFSGLSYINVHALRLSFMAGCLFNLLVLGGVSVFLLSLFFFFPSGSSSSASPAPSGYVVVTLPAISTVSPLPTVSPPATLPPAPTFTPWPTFTPAPTSTPLPTLAPLPTSTPFTLTIVMATPAPSPTRLYNYAELLAGAPTPALISEYKYAFYRAVCLADGQSRIVPKIVGLPEIVSGLHWRLWNDYGWLSDTADESQFEESYAEDTTFFLSSDPAVFHLALFYFDQQISDAVMIDYPGVCSAVEVVYLRSARSSGGYAPSVWLPAPNGGVVLTESEVVSVSISP